MSQKYFSYPLKKYKATVFVTFGAIPEKQKGMLELHSFRDGFSNRPYDRFLQNFGLKTNKKHKSSLALMLQRLRVFSAVVFYEKILKNPCKFLP